MEEPVLDLTDVIDRFRGPLVGLIASWGAASVDASEIAQDSFADAYLTRHRCRGNWEDPEVFGRWLRGIAQNNFRNWRRARRRRERRVIAMDTSNLEQTFGTEQGREDPARRCSALRQVPQRLQLPVRLPSRPSVQSTRVP